MQIRFVLGSIKKIRQVKSHSYTSFMPKKERAGFAIYLVLFASAQ